MAQNAPQRVLHLSQRYLYVIPCKCLQDQRRFAGAGGSLILI